MVTGVERSLAEKEKTGRCTASVPLGPIEAISLMEVRGGKGRNN